LPIAFSAKIEGNRTLSDRLSRRLQANSESRGAILRRSELLPDFVKTVPSSIPSQQRGSPPRRYSRSAIALLKPQLLSHLAALFVVRTRNKKAHTTRRLPSSHARPSTFFLSDIYVPSSHLKPQPPSHTPLSFSFAQSLLAIPTGACLKTTS